MRFLPIIVILCSACTGCAGFQDWHYSVANEWRAHRAWAAAAEAPPPPYRHDYAAGWKCGYYDVCTGGNGGTPTIPPKKYWSPGYQNAAGAAAIDAWYQGYQQGAVAAEQHGFGYWHTLHAKGVGPPGEEVLDEPFGDGQPMPTSPDARTGPNPNSPALRTDGELPTPVVPQASRRRRPAVVMPPTSQEKVVRLPPTETEAEPITLASQIGAQP